LGYGGIVGYFDLVEINLTFLYFFSVFYMDFIYLGILFFFFLVCFFIVCI